MADKGEKPEAPTGFFGRLWGGGKSPEGGKRKAIKANLGERNKLYYDDKLKRWREEGKELEPEDVGLQPPPLATAGFSHSQSAASEVSTADTGHRRSVSSGRYADAGGFGSKTAQSTPSSSPFPAPRPNTAPGNQPSFLIPGQVGGSGGGAPAFFNPAKSAAPVDNPFAPAWGQQKPTPPAFSAYTQQSTPRAGLSPRSQGVSPRGSTQQASPIQAGARKSLEFPAQGPPPQSPGWGVRASSRSGKSGSPVSAAVPKVEDEGDLSVEQWRQQDEKRRAKERQAAAELGAQVLESYTQPIPEGGPAETDSDIDGFGGLESAADSQGYSNSWPGTLEESVGENVLRESSASFGAWGAPAEEGAVTSPAKLPETGLTPLASQGGESAQEDVGGDIPSSGAAEDFFGEVPGVSSEATFQGWGQDEAAGDEAASMVVDGHHDASAYEAGAHESAASPAGEQTYGGLTWAQLQEWAEYYRQEGSSEEQVQDWVNGYLASPDPFPCADASQATAEEDSAQAAGEGDSMIVQQDLGDAQGGLEAAESYPSFQESENDGMAESRMQVTPGEGSLMQRQAAEEGSGGDASAAGGPVRESGGHGEAEVQGGLRAIGAELAANGDLLKPIRDYVAAQQAANPMFGKIIGPLPWDGILTDDEESPNQSPRLQWGNAKPSKGETAAAASLPPIVAEAIQSLSAAVGPGQTNDWLQKVRQNLAEEHGHADGNGKSAQVAEAKKSRSGRSTPKASDGNRQKHRRHEVSSQPAQTEQVATASKLRPGDALHKAREPRHSLAEPVLTEGASPNALDQAAAGKLPPVKVTRAGSGSQASGRSAASERLSGRGPMVLGSSSATPKAPATPVSAKSTASGSSAKSTHYAASLSAAAGGKLTGTPKSDRTPRRRTSSKSRMSGGEPPSSRAPNGRHAYAIATAEELPSEGLREIGEDNPFSDLGEQGEANAVGQAAPALVNDMVSLDGLRDDPMEILGPLSPRGEAPKSIPSEQLGQPKDSLAPTSDNLAWIPLADGQQAGVGFEEEGQLSQAQRRFGFESAAASGFDALQRDDWGEDEGAWENGRELLSTIASQPEPPSAFKMELELEKEALKLPPLKNLKTHSRTHDHEPPTSRAQVAEVEELRKQLAEAEERMRESQHIAFQDHSVLTELEIDNPDSKDTQALDAERTTLAAERAALEDLRAALEADREAIAAEKAALEAAREAVAGAAEATSLAAERAAVSELRDALEADREALRAERDEVEGEKEELATDREALIEENDRLLADREALDAERDTLAANLESAAADKDRLAAKLQALSSQQEALSSELDSLATSRRDLEAQHAALDAQRQSGGAAGGNQSELAALLTALQAEVESLKASTAAMAAENEALADDLLSKDEEIEELTGQLVHTQKNLKAARQAGETQGGNARISDEEVAQMREQARLDFERIGKLAEQNQELQDRLEELEEQGGGGSSEQVAALQAERSQLLQKLEAAEKAAGVARRELKSLKAAYDQLNSRASEAGELAAAFERERDTINAQISELAAQRDALTSETAILRDSLSKAEASTGKHASLADEVAELRRYLAAAEEAAAAGADAVAENDSLGSRLADTKMKLAAVEADLDSVTASRDSLQRDLETLREQLAAVEAEAATTAADSFTEQDRLNTELAGALEQLAALQASLTLQPQAGAEKQRLEEAVAALRMELMHTQEAAVAEQKRLSDELLILQKQLSASEEAVGAESEERMKLLADMAKLEETLQAAEDAATQREVLQQRVDDLEAQLADALASRESLAAEADSLRAGRETLAEKVSGLEAELADALELARVAAAERDSLAAELAQEEAALQSASQTVEERERISGEMTMLQASLDAARAQVAEGEAKVEDLTTNMGNLGGEIGSLHTKTGELGMRIQELSGRMAELEEENEALFERASAAEEDVDASNGRALAAKAETEALAHRLAAAETKLREASQKLEEARSSAQGSEASDAERRQLSERAAWAEERIRQLESQLADAQAQLRETSSRLAEAQSHAGGGDADLAAQLAEKDQDFTDLMVCLGQETAKVEALSSRLQEHGLDVESLLAEVEAAYGYGDDDAPQQEESPKPEVSSVQPDRLSAGLEPLPLASTYEQEYSAANAHPVSGSSGAFDQQASPAPAAFFEGFQDDIAQSSAGRYAAEGFGVADSSTPQPSLAQHAAEDSGAGLVEPESNVSGGGSTADVLRGAHNPGADLFAQDPAADLFSGEQDADEKLFGGGQDPGVEAAHLWQNSGGKQADPAELWQNPEAGKSTAGLFPPVAIPFGGGGSTGDLSFLDNPLEDAEGDWGM